MATEAASGVTIPAPTAMMLRAMSKPVRPLARAAATAPSVNVAIPPMSALRRSSRPVLATSKGELMA